MHQSYHTNTNIGIHNQIRTNALKHTNTLKDGNSQTHKNTHTHYNYNQLYVEI